jgi:hypothetical protein
MKDKAVGPALPGFGAAAVPGGLRENIVRRLPSPAATIAPAWIQIKHRPG